MVANARWDVDRELAIQRRRLWHIADPAERCRAVAPWVDALDEDATLVRSLEAHPGSDQGGLAGPVRTDEALIDPGLTVRSTPDRPRASPAISPAHSLRD